MTKTLLLAALAGALALAGCASNTSTPSTTTPTAMMEEHGVPELDYVATQSGPAANNTTYTFTGPDHTTAGWNLVKLTNQGMEPHQVVFMKLKDGETMEQHMQGMMSSMQPQNGSTDSMSMSTMATTYHGGVGVTSPPAPPGSGAPAYNTSALTFVWLEAGSYVIECEIPGAAGPHMFHGMMKQVNVTGTTPDVATNQPKEDLTLTLKDFSFSWDKTPTSGHHLVKVMNAGSMPHEAPTVHLAPGKTVGDFLNWTATFQGPPPVSDTFGAAVIEKGGFEYVVADFAAGSDYGEMCFMQLPDGTFHFMKGMADQFHVA